MPTNSTDPTPVVTYDTVEKTVVQVVTKTERLPIDRLETTLQQLNAQISTLTAQRDIVQTYINGYRTAEGK